MLFTYFKSLWSGKTLSIKNQFMQHFNKAVAMKSLGKSMELTLEIGKLRKGPQVNLEAFLITQFAELQAKQEILLELFSDSLSKKEEEEDRTMSN